MKRPKNYLNTLRGKNFKSIKINHKVLMIDEASYKIANITQTELCKTGQKKLSISWSSIFFTFAFSAFLIIVRNSELGIISLFIPALLSLTKFLSPQKNILYIELNSSSVKEIESYDGNGLKRLKDLIDSASFDGDIKTTQARVDKNEVNIFYGDEYGLNTVDSSLNINNENSYNNEIDNRGGQIGNIVQGQQISNVDIESSNQYSSTSNSESHKILLRQLVTLGKSLKGSNELNSQQKAIAKDEINEIRKIAEAFLAVNDKQNKKTLKAGILGAMKTLTAAFSGLNASSKLLQEFNKLASLIEGIFN